MAIRLGSFARLLEKSFGPLDATKNSLLLLNHRIFRAHNIERAPLKSQAPGLSLSSRKQTDTHSRNTTAA